VRFLRWLTRSLILLLIALFTAVTAMRLAIHGREVRVPNLRGMTILQAQEAANGNGLIVSVEDKFYSPDVPLGKVISQVPAANSKVRRGWRVHVAESLGPQRVSIPDLVGETERAATMNLRRRGLDLATIAGVPAPGLPADQVIAQEPTPSAGEVLSPKISILLAQEPPSAEYVMPNFVGHQLAEAKEKIAKAGLQLASVSVAASANSAPPADATAPQTTNAAQAASTQTPAPPKPVPVSGIISSQSPPAGSRVTADTQIRLEVAQ
jgi:beta-lactam-binding protein with PASTA domain